MVTDITRYEFHRSAEDPSAGSEHCWAILVASDSGKIRIEHRWRHRADPCGEEEFDGERIYTIDEFSHTRDGKRLWGKVEDALRELGGAI